MSLGEQLGEVLRLERGLAYWKKKRMDLLGISGEKEKDWVWECSGIVASLRDAKNSLRLSLTALSSLELEGEEEEERRSLRWGERSGIALSGLLSTLWSALADGLLIVVSL